MSIKIVHARMDENGKTEGPLTGDQTGKEILEQEFYLNDSVYLLICKDSALAARALNYAMQIAQNNNYGYSQGSEERWTGYKAIVANGGKVDGTGGSFDCATLMFTAYILAGLNLAPDGYTGNLLSRFKATGMFTVYKGAPYISSDKYAKAGCLYLRPKTNERGGHVFMAAQDGTGARETADEGASEADNIDPPYVLSLGKVNVRRMPEKPVYTDRMTAAEKAAEKAAHAVIYTAEKGEKLPLGEHDDDSGWYGVETPNGVGFISNKPKYTKLVKA